MRKVFALVSACILLGGIGCTNFSYLKKTPDGGIVQFKASDKNKVVEELKKQHGDIEVLVAERNGAKKDPAWNDRNKPEEVRERWVEMMNGAMQKATSSE